MASKAVVRGMFAAIRKAKRNKDGRIADSTKRAAASEFLRGLRENKPATVDKAIEVFGRKKK